MSSILADNSTRFCGEIPLGSPDTPGVTLNQALAGKANPRTLVKPTIVAPITELSYWRTNPTTTYSKLNRKTTKYPKLSGWTDESYAVPQQPGIYTATNVFQPINSTNGIAITPSFPNDTILYQMPNEVLYFDTNTNTTYVREQSAPAPAPVPAPTHLTPASTQSCDSGFCQPSQAVTYLAESEPNLASVYDPRFSGYGADNRSYLDEQLGQQRYYYDDVNAIRMPGYLVRSKIDSCATPYGDTYGGLRDGNLSLNSIRPAVEQSWVQNSLDYRESLMKSLMRKRQEETIQRRMAPKNTYNSHRTHGY